MSNTYNRIISAINKFNDDCNGQANLGSPYARADLADIIYHAVMKQSDHTSTNNDQQLEIFTNKDDLTHK